MSVLLLSLAIAYLLIAWFDSDVVSEYAKLLGVNRFYFGEYFGSGINEHLNYLNFLKENHSTEFLVKLVTCPTCCAFWIALALNQGHIIHTLACSFLGLFFYTALVKLMNHANA